MNRKKLESYVLYDKHNGFFKYRNSGRTVDNRNQSGYVRVSIDGKRYLAHRLAWIWCNGDIPEGMEIDHINQVKHDNRIVNLRLGTSRDNKRNRALQSNNTTGINGVSYDKKNNAYEANIKVDGKKVFLGYYDTEAEAKAARYAADRVLKFSELHGMKID